MKKILTLITLLVLAGCSEKYGTVPSSQSFSDIKKKLLLREKVSVQNYNNITYKKLEKAIELLVKSEKI